MSGLPRFLHSFRTTYTAVSDRDPDGEQTTHTRLRLSDMLKGKRIRTILGAVLALLLLSSLVSFAPAGTMRGLRGDRFGFAPTGDEKTEDGRGGASGGDVSGNGNELDAGKESGSGGDAAKMPTTPPPSPPSTAVDWSQFAYTQYVTNTAYLCNSVMLFEILHRLGTRADRLMMYPAHFLAGEDSESREAKLIRKARDEYGVKLQPIEVQSRSGHDGE